MGVPLETKELRIVTAFGLLMLLVSLGYAWTDGERPWFTVSVVGSAIVTVLLLFLVRRTVRREHRTRSTISLIRAQWISVAACTALAAVADSVTVRLLGVGMVCLALLQIAMLRKQDAGRR